MRCALLRYTIAVLLAACLPACVWLILSTLDLVGDSRSVVFTVVCIVTEHVGPLSIVIVRIDTPGVALTLQPALGCPHVLASDAFQDQAFQQSVMLIVADRTLQASTADRAAAGTA